MSRIHRHSHGSGEDDDGEDSMQIAHMKQDFAGSQTK